MGNTLVFPTPADPTKIHTDAIAFLRANCSVKISWEWPQIESDIFGKCAREKGYDSIQLEPQAGQSPMGTFCLTGVTEMVMVNIDGDKTCGVANPAETPLRQGWNADQQCECVNEPVTDSCGLMPQPPYPFNITGEETRLCRLRVHNLSAYCNALTCGTFHCGFA